MIREVPREQINAWANRALENLHGGWHALTEHQLLLIIEATGGFDKIAIEALKDAARPAPGARGEGETDG